MARGSSDGKLVDRSAPKAQPQPKPSFHVSEDHLPAIKDWTVGKKYKINATVEMRSHNKGSPWESDEAGAKKKHEADLVVHRIGTSDGSDASADTAGK